MISAPPIRSFPVPVAIAGFALALLALTLQALPAGGAVGQDRTIEPPSDRLTVVMTELEPFVIHDGDRPDGFYAEIWDVVAAELGVQYEVTWAESFTELLGAVEQGRADVAVAPLTPTAEREVSFDFTSAVIGSGPQLAYHQRAAVDSSLLAALFSPSVRRVLLAAVLGLLILAHLMWLVERNRTDEEGNDFHRSYLHGIWDGFWWATVTVTTVGYGDKAPRSIRGRLVALMAMLLSLFLVGAFVSQVTDVLQDRRSAAPVTTLDDARGLPVGAVAGSSFADFVEGEGVTVVGYQSQTELLEAAERGEVDIIVTNPFALAAVGERYGLVPTGDVLYEEFETFGLGQDSRWREPINQVLADLQASGEIEEIVDRWMN